MIIVVIVTIMMFRKAKDWYFFSSAIACDLQTGQELMFVFQAPILGLGVPGSSS